jgi:hypothetical protein
MRLPRGGSVLVYAACTAIVVPGLGQRLFLACPSPLDNVVCFVVVTLWINMYYLGMCGVGVGKLGAALLGLADPNLAADLAYLGKDYILLVQDGFAALPGGDAFLKHWMPAEIWLCGLGAVLIVEAIWS